MIDGKGEFEFDKSDVSIIHLCQLFGRVVLALMHDRNRDVIMQAKRVVAATYYQLSDLEKEARENPKR